MCAKYSCNATTSNEQNLNNFHLRGTSLGGWLVLEPWITPSLFYQFLGKTSTYGDDAYQHIAIDSYTFCTALGSAEANRQLRQHWKTWVDEAQILNLSRIGVETLRIPIGDWMFIPYYPYIGCWDGSLDELNRVLALCAKHNIKVILDIHAMKMSQNGLDNSGDTGDYDWFRSGTALNGRRESFYRHWDIRGGNWAGQFNVTTHKYDSFNKSHIDESLHLVDLILDRYRNNSVVIGLEPLNEPWWFIPIDELKDFYWQAYNRVQSKAPHWITLLHDSFRLEPSVFGGEWMKNCANWAMDTHLYQAWSDAVALADHISMACASGSHLELMESLGIPIIVGEWSLAFDNCAMWINGFNDNVPGFPKVACQRVSCPAPYMGQDQPGAPPPSNSDIDTMDPRGSGGDSFVINGTCPVSGLIDLNASHIKSFGLAQLRVFDRSTHGNFFWNFRTELEPLWDYQAAVQRNWLPRDWDYDSADGKAVEVACSTFAPKRFVSIYGSSERFIVVLMMFAAVAMTIHRLASSLRHCDAGFRGFVLGYENIPSESESQIQL